MSTPISEEESSDDPPPPPGAPVSAHPQGESVDDASAAPAEGAGRRLVQPRQLSPLLVWAVVFCDIGTSIYYVPGILYSQVGSLAPLFVFGTTAGFLLLSMKYVEISWRNPEGGGVVTVATKAFGPLWGCFGGMLIIVDYFLTAAISSVSGMYYLSSLFPAVQPFLIHLTIFTLALLAAVNVIGIRESAILSLAMAAVTLAVDLVVIGVTAVRIGPPEWAQLQAYFAFTDEISWEQWLVGFAGAWLAFSGLESISQLSPAMRTPVRATARRGMILVVASILITSPVLTLFSVVLLPNAVKAHESERFISELGAMWGGFPLKVAVVATASTLLLFAANTAIIGSYHVFLALAERGFVPAVLTARSRRYGTPHLAIAVATGVPMLIIALTQGHLETLGEMYAFGLLGAFVLSSAGLDVIRWRRGRRRLGFWLGILTTLMVVTAWSVNLVTKQLATIFGGGLVAIGMLVAVLAQQRRFLDFLWNLPLVSRIHRQRIRAAERQTDDVPELLSVGQALELRPLYPSRTLLALRGKSEALLQEAIVRERGRGGTALYALYVDERPGLFAGTAATSPGEEGIETLRFGSEVARRENFMLIPVWTISYNAAEAIARVAEQLEVDTVMVGVSRRSALYHLLRGHVVNGLGRRLPRNCRLLLYG